MRKQHIVLIAVVFLTIFVLVVCSVTAVLLLRRSNTKETEMNTQDEQTVEQGISPENTQELEDTVEEIEDALDEVERALEDMDDALGQDDTVPNL